ncbi:hypothetical protein D9757_003763 [Collybiopsis confluens]|uniref:Uncharacterized protein n=1 Tax=Collybiopsis confluens TaxID=2823264 RepID=A0A8H5MDR2_9AGAR|nr:hypothetical protein D9757_003763 [Collybiopsis confluens]
MKQYNFLGWFENSRLSPISPNLISATQIEVLRVKWNRCRKNVPFTIYNGVIYDWIEGKIPRDDGERDLFSLELAEAIGSPEFLRHLLGISASALNTNPSTPPFGLGFILSGKNLQNKTPYEMLDTVLGEALCVGSVLAELHDDWLCWKRQTDSVCLEPTTQSFQKAVNSLSENPQIHNKRAQPEPQINSTFECAQDAENVDPQITSVVKHPRAEGSQSIPQAPRTRSGFFRWIDSASTRFTPNSTSQTRLKLDSDKENSSNITQETAFDSQRPNSAAAIGYKKDGASDWICVSAHHSVNSCGSDSSNLGFSATTSSRLPEITPVSSFSLSPYTALSETSPSNPVTRSLISSPSLLVNNFYASRGENLDSQKVEDTLLDSVEYLESDSVDIEEVEALLRADSVESM